MSPDPDWEMSLGPLLIRRWGKFVRVSFRKRPAWTFGFNLPGEG